MTVDSSSGAVNQMMGIRRYMALNAVKQTAVVDAMASIKAIEQASENAKEFSTQTVPVSPIKGQNLDITV